MTCTYLISGSAENLSIKNSTANNYQVLLDGNTSTCINPMTDMTVNTSHYIVTVEIAQGVVNGTMTVQFQQNVACFEKQVTFSVIFTFLNKFHESDIRSIFFKTCCRGAAYLYPLFRQ